MFTLLLSVLRALLTAVFSRASLVVENVALRQQLVVLSRGTPRPRLRRRDRAFWMVLRRLWPVLVVVFYWSRLPGRARGSEGVFAR